MLFAASSLCLHIHTCDGKVKRTLLILLEGTDMILLHGTDRTMRDSRTGEQENTLANESWVANNNAEMKVQLCIYQCT